MSGTVSVVDPKSWSVREVDVGLAPSGLALAPDEKTLAVANGHSDSVSLIDAASLRKERLKIPDLSRRHAGQPADRRRFHAGRQDRSMSPAAGTTRLPWCAPATWDVQGAIPTAWFPSAVAAGAEGSLRIVNIKGVGNTADGKGAFNSQEYEGVLETIRRPAPAQIAAGTREVKAANSPQFEPAGGVPNLPSLGIQHVFLSSRRTAPTIRFSATSPKATEIRNSSCTAATSRPIITRWPNST